MSMYSLSKSCPAPRRPMTAPEGLTRPGKRTVGGLRAASAIWELHSAPAIPALRQCNTFEEIARRRANLRSALREQQQLLQLQSQRSFQELEAAQGPDADPLTPHG